MPMPRARTVSPAVWAPILCLFLPLCLSLGWSRAAAATERILSFDADIELAPDASLMVRETIRVQVEGRLIRHGIYRDFPTHRQDRAGHDFVVGFHPREALVDGAPDDFVVDDMRYGRRVTIGDDQVLLSPGEHVFTLTYRTDRQLGFFADHDELYWNVTGNDWQFPIDRVSVDVHAPDIVARQLTEISAWSGVKGAREQSHTELRTAGGVRFQTTRAFALGEGFTILLAWPKGLIFPPGLRDRTRRFVEDEPEIRIAMAGLLALLSYCGLAWLLVGRSPRAGQVSPSSTPPGGLSPAELRFAWKMGFDDRTFAVALVSMAVKGYLTISRSDEGIYSLHRTMGREDLLAPEERTIAEILSGLGRRIVLINEHHVAIGVARTALKEALASGVAASCFKKNRRWTIPGFVLAALVVLTTSASAAASSEGAPIGFCVLTLFLAILSLVVWASVLEIWRSLRTAATVAADAAKMRRRALAYAVTGAIFAAADVAILVGLTALTSWLATVIALLTVAACWVLPWLVRAITRAGRPVIDQIAGFKLFLESPEAAPFAGAGVPYRTADVPYRAAATFESNLPYALALEVEASWTRRFPHLLAQAAADRPRWCDEQLRSWLFRGDSPPPVCFSELGQSFCATLSGAASAPDSDGGSGGGGSSGGGGGGGGGGGW